MTTDDERKGKAGDARNENAALRREVQYGKEALTRVKGLRDGIMRSVDDIDDLIELIRQRMAETGETDA